jgi:hypothetical protein
LHELVLVLFESFGQLNYCGEPLMLTSEGGEFARILGRCRI